MIRKIEGRFAFKRPGKCCYFTGKNRCYNNIYKDNLCHAHWKNDNVMILVSKPKMTLQSRLIINISREAREILVNNRRKMSVRRETQQLTTITRKSPTKRKQKQIPKFVRKSVWITYVGLDKAQTKCYLCPNMVSVFDFECGHVIAQSLGGSDEVSNLRPICSDCNKSVGTQNMKKAAKKYGIAVEC